MKNILKPNQKMNIYLHQMLSNLKIIPKIFWDHKTWQNLVDISCTFVPNNNLKIQDILKPYISGKKKLEIIVWNH